MSISNRVLLSGFVVLLAAGPAYPQNKDLLRLNADVLQLQQQVKQLQISVDDKTAAIASLVEKMADQMNTIQTAVAKLSEGIDSVKTSDDKTAAELRTQVNNLNANIDQVNEGLTSIRTRINSVSDQLTAQAAQAEPLASPEDLMRSAGVDKISGNFDLAIEEYREFLSKYPNHTRAAEAQANIGDIFFGQKKFDQALIEYDLFLQKYMNDDRTSSALYKKGLAHAELNQITEAKAVLTRVQKDFPGTTEAVGAAAKLKELATPPRGR